MIQSIRLNNFKAFYSEFFFRPDNLSFLLYGANGAGKSSIYDALKVFLFKGEYDDLITRGSTPEEDIQFKQDFWRVFNNRKTNTQFSILINESTRENFDREKENVFMMSIDDVSHGETISLKDIILGLTFDYSGDKLQFCQSNYEFIADNVNDQLANQFRENFSISITRQNSYDVRFEFPDKGISAIREYKSYLNEARINLVIILISLSIAELCRVHSKDNIIILDDIISSLDVTNRLFLLNYMITEFSSCQFFFLTHNIHLYNLFMYLVNETHKLNHKWTYKNIYEFDQEHKLLDQSTPNQSTIKEFFQDNPESFEIVGNQIRQRFEVLLYTLSKLFHIGAIEDSNKILSRIESRNYLYHYEDKDANDLVDEISRSLNGPSDHHLKRRILSKINTYKRNDYTDFLDVMKKLTMFRKITLHPMSHGSLGRSTYTLKEIEMSLYLLGKFENYCQRLSGKNVESM